MALLTGETEKKFRNMQAIKKVKNRDSRTSEDVHYHLFYEGVPKEFEKYAETDLNETSENVKKGMQKLKKFLQDKNLPGVDDHTLRLVLRNCKYDLKKSVTKLEKFLNMRCMILERIAELDLEKVEYILKETCFTFLPYRDRFGRAIFYTQPSVSFEMYDTEDAIFCFFALVLYLMNFSMTSMFGLVWIGDCKTPSIPLMYKILIPLKNNLRILLNLPIRLGRVNLLRENFLTRWFFNISRPIIPFKIYQRISFHGENLEDLHELFHPDILPEECGGNMGPLNTAFYREELINFIKKLKAEHHRKTKPAS